MNSVLSTQGMSRTRLLRHPGPVAPDRFAIGLSDSAKNARIRIPAGQTLLDGLTRATALLAPGRASSAVFSLRYGSLSCCVFCLAVEDHRGRTVATYSPWQRQDRVHILGGSATVGCGLDGEPMVHCHALFLPKDGSRALGGHLDPTATRVGEAGLSVFATLLTGLSVNQVADPETNHAVFMPRDKSS